MRAQTVRPYELQLPTGEHALIKKVQIGEKCHD